MNLSTFWRAPEYWRQLLVALWCGAGTGAIILAALQVLRPLLADPGISSTIIAVIIGLGIGKIGMVCLHGGVQTRKPPVVMYIVQVIGIVLVALALT